VSFPVAKLGEVCSFVRGLTYSKSDEVEFSSNVVIRATNIDLGTHKLDFNELRYISDSIQIKDDKRLKKDDILICTASGSKSHLGKVAIVDSDLGMAFGGFMGALRVNPLKITPQYFFTFLVSSEFKRHIESLSDGANINNLKFSQIENLEIPLPPLSTQQKIVAKLDLIFAEIDKAAAAAESSVKNAEALFQSYLTEVFERGGDDWIDKKLSDVSVYFGRGKSKHRPRNDDSLYGGSYPFIQTGDVRNAQKYITSYSKTYNEKGLAQSKLWKANTVCITIAANIAEIGVLKFDACFPDSVIGIVVDNEKISEDFLYLMLLFAQQLIKSKSKGSAQENINLGTFEDMFFKVPPKVNQDKIVTELNHLKNITDFIYSSKMKKINSFHLLKQSILNQAFNGELVKE